jgi:hypothetical protein
MFGNLKNQNARIKFHLPRVNETGDMKHTLLSWTLEIKTTDTKEQVLAMLPQLLSETQRLIDSEFEAFTVPSSYFAGLSEACGHRPDQPPPVVS